jgi:hypothetical protein
MEGKYLATNGIESRIESDAVRLAGLLVEFPAAIIVVEIPVVEQ